MLRSYAWLVFCVTIWGSNFIFGAILVKEFPPMLLSITRLSFTCTFYIVFALSTGRVIKPTLRDWSLLLPLAVLTMINQSSFYIGLQDADPTVSALITALSPIAVGLLAAIFLRERITLRMALGSLVAVTGVFFVVGSGGGGGFALSRGELLMVVAMMTFAISIILTRKLIEYRDPFFATSYSTVLGSAMLLPIALVREDVSGMSTALWAWGLLIGCALLMQVMCSLIWNRELQRVGAGKAAIFLNLQPFVAMVLGYLILNKPVTGIQTVGAVLIIGGVLLGTIQTAQAMTAGKRAEAQPVRTEPERGTPIS